MTRARVIGVVASIILIAVLVRAYDTSIAQAAFAVLIGAALLRVGWAMISGLAQVPPAPLEAGLLRKVKIMYRCSNCGAEVRMTVAPDEDPEPPRHCMEDMDLVAPIDD